MPYLGPAPVVGRYLVVDDISSGFDGNEVNFNLTESTVAVKPGAAPNLLLSLGGVIQKPGTDFTINGSTLTFTTAPVAGTTFFATLLGDAYAVGTPSDGTVIPASIASSGNFSFPGNLTTAGAMYVNGGTTNTLLTLTSTDVNTSIKLVDDSSHALVSYGSTNTLGLLLSSDAGNEVADSIIRFKVDNAEKVRITSAGELLIGTTTASTNVKVSIVDTGTTLLRIENTDDGTAGIIFVNTGSSNWQISNTNAVLKFAVAGNERLSFAYSGQIAMGTAAVESGWAITNTIAEEGIVTKVASITDDTMCIAAQAWSTENSKNRKAYVGLRKASGEEASGFVYMQQRDAGNSYLFTDNSNIVRITNTQANIGSTTGTVVGDQTSDIRLKNNLGNVTYGLTEINAINPIKFTMKKDTTRQRIGFSAQDVKTIIPEAVYETKETIEVDSSNVEDVLAMEYVALIPVLVNAVKELSAKVTALESA
tara:strand:+ start:1388 stop:2824 length:1437 start_codon:yes stop_codon:yes gene_type:complete